MRCWPGGEPVGSNHVYLHGNTKAVRCTSTRHYVQCCQQYTHAQYCNQYTPQLSKFLGFSWGVLHMDPMLYCTPGFPFSKYTVGRYGHQYTVVQH
jgi:hypothetical protein